jgi:hypothetical protein
MTKAEAVLQCASCQEMLYRFRVLGPQSHEVKPVSSRVPDWREPAGKSLESIQCPLCNGRVATHKGDLLMHQESGAVRLR